MAHVRVMGLLGLPEHALSKECQTMLGLLPFKLSSWRVAGAALFAWCALATHAAQAGALIVNVSDARNDDGLIRCGLFADANAWRHEERTARAVAAELENGKAVCDFGEVPSGTYAVAVFHAEHRETKINYGFLGKPKQGVGFSRNPSIALGAPDFEAASVEVGAEKRVLEIRLKY